MSTIKHIGDGSHYYPGVPMRDLTQDEWDALPDAVKMALVRDKLFDAKVPKAAEAVSAPAPKSNKGG